MAIFRCSKCNHVLETSQAIGTSIPCPKCQQQGPVWDTTFFTTKLLEKYFSLLSTHTALQQQTQPAPHAGNTAEPSALAAINISNTDLLANPDQHAPLVAWLEKKNISSLPNHAAVDTTGFFDEMATIIGRHYPGYKLLLDQICFAYKKDYQVASISLAKMEPKEANALIAFCHQLHDHSFITRYIHDKKEKSLKVVLQTALQIKQFFNGQWLEWFALIQALEVLQQAGSKFSCARSLQIAYQNGEKHELDVLLLADGHLPVCIECKSGDYRSNIEKYRSLRKKLGLEKKQFIICVAGLENDKAQGLSSTYELTFCNEATLKQHLAELLA